jgi:hypothetical protein
MNLTQTLQLGMSRQVTWSLLLQRVPRNNLNILVPPYNPHYVVTCHAKREGQQLMLGQLSCDHNNPLLHWALLKALGFKIDLSETSVRGLWLG